MTKIKLNRIPAIIISSLVAIAVNAILSYTIPSIEKNLSIVFVAIVSASVMGEFWPKGAECKAINHKEI